ncbi:Anthocyanidine rhamnosyl-transferase [Heracleum sosnowskyi]|uniref:Anthocyanidine rhamnosyl-transferase n=1 Tax=Heracleum sosnowskyi TaxID=360622 RepID=A0AAD8M6U2_9APIA|nr:Anthocyanidine rhamnosyl-transferase [Heracleum sosnowskyi]
MVSVKKMHIVMFPWLAFGHLLPYLKLAKLIAEKGHQISFISTPRNIDRLPKLPHNVAPFINFVKIPLPCTPNLPENAEATSDVPFNKVKYLKIAYDHLQSPVTHFLESNSVDWILCDFVSYWLGPVASCLGIPCAWYSIFTASALGFIGPASNLIHGDGYRVNPEDFTVKPKWVEFETKIAMFLFQILAHTPDFEADESGNATDLYRIGNTIKNCDMVAIRSSIEFEPEWLKLVDEIYEKPVIPVGLLPAADESNVDECWIKIKDWVDKQAHGSVIYVALGSETIMNQVQVTELALGLELSGLPFFWAIKKARGLSDPGRVELPEGFEERTRGRGMVYTTWVPQIKIVSHDSVGGLLIHSGWSSVVEAVQFGKALVLLPFLGDQGIIAKQLEEKKLGFMIPRNELNGGFTRDSVAASVKLVMVDEQGKIYRDKVKEFQGIFSDMDRQDSYVDNLIACLQNHNFIKK